MKKLLVLFTFGIMLGYSTAYYAGMEELINEANAFIAYMERK